LAGGRYCPVSTDEQAAIDEFLSGKPTSDRLREWRDTLRQRAKRLRQELRTADQAQASALRARLAELERQIAALDEEALITEFVEDSVRVTLAMGSMTAEQQVEE
jgi:hypothetical protein